MKNKTKIILGLSLSLLILPMNTWASGQDREIENKNIIETNVEKEKIYNIPVKLMQEGQDRESMGNKALVSTAKVIYSGDKVKVELTFKGLDLNGMKGHLTNLFYYENNISPKDGGKPIETKVEKTFTDTGMDGQNKEFNQVFSFTIDKNVFEASDFLWCRVWVDVMDGFMGGPGSGAQNARLVFDKANKTDVTPGGELPNPPTPPAPPAPPTPNLGNKDKLIEALRNYSNLGGPQYTYDSNMKYVIAYNSAMALLSRNNVTDSEINSAISNLKSTANGLTKDSNSGNWNNNNNNSWGNNNSSWGNNNNSWGSNNNSWGSNNNSWGSSNSNNNNGPVTIQYEVPVEVLHAHQGGYSMANSAINHTARVEERNGEFRYSVQFGQMQKNFAGKPLVGNLTNLFVLDGGKTRANQSSGNTWSWVMKGKYDRVNVAIWVDAMDEIAGKGPGGGEQNAILSFNWNGAKEVGRVGGNNNQNQQNQNQQNQQKQQNQNQQAVQNNNTNNFTDTSGHWAKTAIDYVVSKGYFAGLSKTEFGPNKAITRGQFVSVLGRMLNVNVNDYKDQNFKDVKSGMYYSPYIAWANKVGIVSGVGQGNFAPDKELTREEMAVMMTKFLKLSGKNLNAKGKTNAFKDDAKIQGWAKDSVKEMARLGLVSGMGDGSFAPKSQFTRAQVAQVLYNIDHN